MPAGGGAAQRFACAGRYGGAGICGGADVRLLLRRVIQKAPAAGAARLPAGDGADALVPAIVDAVGERFVRWYESRPPDVGATVARAIQAFQRHGSWDSASADVAAALGERAAGNGALMRTLPVSFFWPDDPARTIAVSRALTRMTHPAPHAEWCSAYYNLLVLRLLRGEGPLDAAMDAAAADMRRIAPDLEATGLWAHVRAAGRLSRGAVENPTGYSVRTLIAALWAVLQGATAEEAIVLAANLGGDADTVAAVAGGLAGAVWGGEALPRRWVGALGDRGEGRMATPLGRARAAWAAEVADVLEDRPGRGMGWSGQKGRG